MNHSLQIISRVWDKLADIVKYPAGWIAGLGLFIADAVSGGKLVIYLVVIVSTVDLFCGIAVSISRKGFTLSELIRLTVEKVTVYGLALLVFLCLDKVIDANTSLEITLTAGLVGVIITLAESWSFLASLLILFPDNVLLKLLQKALTGEIARKLNCSEAEVEKLLNAARRRRRIRRGKDGKFIKKKQPKRHDKATHNPD